MKNQIIIPKGWISVNDELPEYYTRCFVIEADGRIEICNYIQSIDYFRKNTNYAGFLDEQGEQPSTYAPTHWMPVDALLVSDGINEKFDFWKDAVEFSKRIMVENAEQMIIDHVKEMKFNHNESRFFRSNLTTAFDMIPMIACLKMNLPEI